MTKNASIRMTIEFFEHALKVSRYMENRREEARILVDLGETCYQLGNLDPADFYLTKAERFLFNLEKPWVESLVNRLKLLRESLKSA